MTRLLPRPRPRRKTLTLAYATRKLAEIDAQIAYWEAKEVGSDWRLKVDKAIALASLRSKRPRFDRVVNPRGETEYTGSF